jgi:hypothetical protein
MESTPTYDRLNQYGERLEDGDIILNLDYWDCECKQKFIHPINEDRCAICGFEQDECPSSRENEVNLFLGRV